MVDWNALSDENAHRPWPLPKGPWVMTMTWADLLFAHWTVPKAALEAHIPAGLELETFDDRAWIGVVPFWMENVGPRGLGWLPARLPGPRAFPELNVRTYVRAGGKPGVFFFSLDATSPFAVWGARTFFDLPYLNAKIRVDKDDGWTVYESRRRDPRGGEGEFAGRYRPRGDVYLSKPGTLEHWLTERYCLYADAGDGRIRRGEIHHVPWPLRPAEARIDVNTAARARGLELRGEPETLHYVDRIDVVAWWPEDA
jgi:uncharacterized protein YqjF (DUF2071 family)